MAFKKNALNFPGKFPGNIKIKKYQPFGVDVAGHITYGIPLLMAIYVITKAVILGTIDMFIIKQVVIAVSAASVVPLVLLVKGKRVSEDIIKEVPLFAVLSIAMAWLLEMLSASLLTFMEIAAVSALVLYMFWKWQLYEDDRAENI